MKEFENKNRGVLFNNQDKKQKDTDRDYGGNINVVCPHCDTGSDHWLNGWLQTSHAGQRYLSISVKPKVPKQEVVARSVEGNGAHATIGDDLNDEIPF